MTRKISTQCRAEQQVATRAVNDVIAAATSAVGDEEARRCGSRITNPKAVAIDSCSSVLFLDCDDTLYDNDWHLAQAITAKIEAYTTEVLHLAPGKAYELYQLHGTCLRGLQEEQIPFDLEHYLTTVHEVPLAQYISEDVDLQKMFQRLKPEMTKCVFTASTHSHAKQCMEILGITKYFKDAPIIDVRAVNFFTKHDIEAHKIAMKIMNVTRPEACILVDDSKRNIETAKSVGWVTVLIGLTGRHGEDQRGFEHADYVIDSVKELPNIFPQFFEPAQEAHMSGCDTE